MLKVYFLVVCTQEEKPTLDKVFYFHLSKTTMQSTNIIYVTTTYLLDVDCKTKQCTLDVKWPQICVAKTQANRIRALTTSTSGATTLIT